MTKESVINYEESTIITLEDINAPLHDLRSYKRELYCPKCQCSLICTPKEYVKNNTINSMNQDKNNDNNGEPVNFNWKNLIVKCDSCKYIDLIIKFLKEDKEETSNPYQSILRHPYYTPPGGVIQQPKPSYMQSPSSGQSKPAQISNPTLYGGG
jgi:hypothetical protein